ncbi:MAG: site-2 protease family protein [Clostridia bacterium]|nr:site-2 protease family protein [Clostridia bacterium]
MLTNLFSYIIEQLQAALFTLPVVLPAIICHECAHGFVSYKLGDPTAKYAGRLTLNPLKHLDPIGTLCMIFFHVGWANPVPIDPRYYRNRKKGIIYVSLAGPVTNFILAFLSLFTEGLLMKFGSPHSTVIWILCQFCYYSAIVNIGLGLFNLIPIPPLDGSKILGELSCKVNAFYWKYQRYWRLVMILCVVTGALSKPLGLLNEQVIRLLWQIIKAILFI